MASTARATMPRKEVPVVEPVFFPSGVADPGGHTGYVADGSDIVAVALADGRPRWRTDRAAQPLIADADRLVAAAVDELRAQVMRVVVLDAGGHGEVLLVSEPVVFPNWVTVSAERPESFRMRATVEGDRLRLEWEARARYSGGAAPPPHVTRAAAREAAGVFSVLLESGAVESPPAGGPPSPVPAIRRPPLVADDLSEPWLAGTTVARLVWHDDDAEQILMLEISDPSTGRSGFVLELARGEGLAAEVTPDGCHVLVHAEPAPPRADRWQVFAVPSGSRIATLTRDPGALSPVILGERLFHLVEEREAASGGRALRARELASDQLVWALALTPRRRSAAPRLRQ